MKPNLHRSVLLVATLLLSCSALPGWAAELRPASSAATHTASARADSSLAGKWTGTMTVPQGTGKMEITFQGRDTAWKATGNVHIDPSLPAPAPQAARDLQVKEKAVTFHLTIEGADVKFTGTLGADGLSGTLVATESGREAGRGTWKLSRATR